MDLTIAVAVGAGLLSFLSPCVLPLVPAYIGQLSAVAVVGRADGRAPRWLAVSHALAYVAGFGAVFTILGITATYAAGPLFDYLPFLRQAGGILLIVLGLNLAGVLRIPALDRTWRPLEAGAAGAVANATGTMALQGGEGTGARFADRLGGRIVGVRGGWLALHQGQDCKCQHVFPDQRLGPGGHAEQLQVFFAHAESPCSLLTHMALTPHRCGPGPFEAAATALGSRIQSADWLSQSSKRTLPSSASLPGTSEFSLSSVPK